MSDVSKESKSSKLRRLRSIYQVHYNIQKREDEMMAKPIAFPTDNVEIQAYALQVAGHKKTEDTKYSGLLQCSNGTILKPIIKEAQKREIDFYERLSSTKDEDLLELRSCVPKYFGCKKFTYNGFEQDYIILEDLTERMLEPCVMDVKIGKRTWDPLASEEKIRNEEAKYFESKQQFGFCIPGFHVYKHSSGQLHKYNKDYGKRLHGDAVKDAIRKYLTGVGGPLCRSLVLSLLSGVWRVQRWARRQRALQLYSASLLLVYDAAATRHCCGAGDNNKPRATCRRGSGTVVGGVSGVGVGVLGGSNFSGSVCERGPVYSRVSAVPTLPLAAHLALHQGSPTRTGQCASGSWEEALHRLSATHSPDHDYEGKLSRMRLDYRATLDRLSSPTRTPTPVVKVIDFAHAFFNEEQKQLDDNFREGIDNFVQIFEEFLAETEDHCDFV